MKRKKIFIISVVGILLIGSVFYHYYQIKSAKIYVKLRNDRVVEVYDKVHISDFIKMINGKLIEDSLIDTSKVGNHQVTFSYINDDNIKVSYSYDIKVRDTTPPIIGVSDYTVPLGYEKKLSKHFFCGDNYDDRPKCVVEGNYDVNTLGTYSLKFKAVDSSGNENSANFKLNVVEEPKNIKSLEEKTYTYFSDVVEKYKSKNTKIGIDVSHWQGQIDYEKLKEAKIEFVFIRVGSENAEGEFYLDKKFEEYIKGFHKVGIPVGIYYYSYADSVKKAEKEAKWVVKQIKKYKIELPVVFDWENWSNYQEYHLSFHSLTEVAETFLKEVKKSGYEAMLYSSKYYLENIWFPTKYKIWLAHYTQTTNYQGKYYVWQLCSNGKVDGINDNSVDIDILYK